MRNLIFFVNLCLKEPCARLLNGAYRRHPCVSVNIYICKIFVKKNLLKKRCFTKFMKKKFPKNLVWYRSFLFFRKTLNTSNNHFEIKNAQGNVKELIDPQLKKTQSNNL